MVESQRTERKERISQRLDEIMEFEMECAKKKEISLELEKIAEQSFSDEIK